VWWQFYTGISTGRGRLEDRNGGDRHFKGFPKADNEFRSRPIARGIREGRIQRIWDLDRTPSIARRSAWWQRLVKLTEDGVEDHYTAPPIKLRKTNLPGKLRELDKCLVMGWTLPSFHPNRSSCIIAPLLQNLEV